MQDIDQLIRTCQLCKLHLTRHNAVPGVGSLPPSILLVGEAPGEQEDLKGIPFIGNAGKELDKLLASILLDREQVYITNIVKCRPPSNRDPESGEIAACSTYLYAQVGMLVPKLIVTLGRLSMSVVLQPGLTISHVHGTVLNSVFNIPALPLYHPAAMLHNPNLRQVVAKDFLKIPAILAGIQHESETTFEESNHMANNNDNLPTYYLNGEDGD